MIDLNLVRVFVTVYQLGSYTKAAEKLELGQPAVSLAIKRLEKHVGLKLFAKKGRGVEATEQARLLASELEPDLLKIENALNPKRELSAYCTEAILHFLGEISDVRFLPTPMHNELELEHLRSNVVDLAINIIETSDPAFVTEELRQEKLVVVCRSAHPRILGETITKEQFVSESQVILRTRHNGVRLLDLYTKGQLSKQQERVEASSIASVMTMVACTNYLGVVTESFAHRWSKAMGLKVLDYPFESVTVSLGLIYHKRHKLNPHHKAVREAIKRALSSTSSLQ